MISKISSIKLDENSLIRSESNRQERERIITDILKESNFHFYGHNGNYDLYIEVISSRLVINIDSTKRVEISMTPLRRIIKDYAIICESYFEVMRNSDPRKTEAIDMGRRAVHNEGAEILTEILEDKISMDFDTARKFFTLIYMMQVK